MSLVLPLRANLEWLKKASKDRLDELRASDPSATLSDAQFAIARDYGFSSWRALKTEVDRRRAALDERAALIARDTTPIAADDAQLAELFAAIRKGEIAAVATLLNKRPALVRAKDASGQAPIHVAAENNDAKLGAILFSSGADLDATMAGSAHTAMSWAVTCNALDFAKTMAALGERGDLFCSAGIGDITGIRAAFDDRKILRPRASRTGSSRYDEHGVRLPCPPDTAREMISDALYIACRNGQPEAVRELLTHGPDLSFRAYDGGTALHWAYFSGNSEVIALLVAAGADTARHDNSMNAAPRAFGICAAASWGFGWLVNRLVTGDPSLINERTADGRSVSSVARAAGRHQLADSLDAMRAGNASE